MKTCTDYYYFVISFCVANCVLSVLDKENDDDDDDDDLSYFIHRFSLCYKCVLINLRTYLQVLTLYFLWLTR